MATIEQTRRDGSTEEDTDFRAGEKIDPSVFRDLMTEVNEVLRDSGVVIEVEEFTQRRGE